MLSPGHDLKLSAHLLFAIMTKSYESLEELIEDKAREAKDEQIVTRSQAWRKTRESRFSTSYNTPPEGGGGI